MPEEKKEWSFREFRAFLLLYASHIDMQFSEEERELIRKRLGERNFQQLIKEFDRLNDYQCLQRIEDYKGKHFPTEKEKQILLEDIRDIIRADGVIHPMEHAFVLILEKIL